MQKQGVGSSGADVMNVIVILIIDVQLKTTSGK